MTSPKRIVDYKTLDGKVPFREWLFSKYLDKQTRAGILVRLHNLAFGNPGDCKPVSGGVFELRFHFGAGYRIYFSCTGKEIILLLCGGDKSTQKKDIRLAAEYWEDFKRRNGLI